MQTTQKNNAKILKAVANQYRLEIIDLLLSGEKNVGELNKTVKVSQPALSQHLTKLRLAGIIGQRREQRNMYYFISNPHVTRIIGVLSDMQIAKVA